MWVQWICDRTSKSFGKFLWRVHTRLYTYRKQKFDRVEKRTREIMFYRSISCNRSINHANGRVWLARRRLLIMTTKKIDKILFCREIIIGRVHFCCCPTERILTSRLRFFYYITHYYSGHEYNTGIFVKYTRFFFLTPIQEEVFTLFFIITFFMSTDVFIYLFFSVFTVQLQSNERQQSNNLTAGYIYLFVDYESPTI